MGGVSRLLIAGLVVALGAATAGAAGAAIPDPANSTVPNVVYNPSGGKEYKVIVRDGSNMPLSGALVRIIFSEEADTLVCWCAGQTHPSIDATTDVNGEASFFISAGGCLDPGQFAVPPVTVYAAGVLLAEVGGVAADAVDGGGLLPHMGWNPGGSCETSLPDAVHHTPPIQLGLYSFCSDFNSDGAVNLEDAVFITDPISEGHFCVAQ
jgi:hypothetical protein